MAASRPFLFAPGAGAPSSSGWMVAWKQRLEQLGHVVPFDYPYQRAGKKSPDRPPVLVSSHRAELARLRAEHPGPIVLIGKSMGGRIGCHVAVELEKEDAPASERPAALVCMGYPLVAPGGAVRDEVLLALRTPVLFIQGTRDSMCPLDRLAAVRERMQATNELHVVDGGDHSLVVQKGQLAKQGLTQAGVDERIFAAIEGFVARFA
ncbi:MAG TPA: alpha/beta fold hydrolase [Polyangiaceae bacterium]|nr:alpha/beta fold hydrolase [Polyangiaceae bacterium]